MRPPRLLVRRGGAGGSGPPITSAPRAKRGGAAGARVVFEPINQIGRARNAGAAAAAGQWLGVVGADSPPSRGLLADVARTIASGRCLAGGSTVTVDHQAMAVRLAIGLWNLTSRVLRWGAG